MSTFNHDLAFTSQGTIKLQDHLKWLETLTRDFKRKRFALLFYIFSSRYGSMSDEVMRWEGVEDEQLNKIKMLSSLYLKC